MNAAAKKRRRQSGQESDAVKEPHTIVIARGVRNTLIQRLKRDIRCVFLPNTAQKIKERKFNKTRDFLEVCGPLGVTHVLALFSTETSLNLKLMKVPQGPTISFKVMSYSVMTSVQRAVGKTFDVKHGLGGAAPLVIMTNFQKCKHHDLTVMFLQNMFPSVNPHSMEIKNKKRVVLFDYDPEEDCIRFRHYRVTTPVSGMNKAMKALLYDKGVPDLGDMDTMTEFLTKSGYASESEGEETVDLASDLTSRGEPTKRRVKLTEIGPRMDLMLHKIEQGQMEGLVLYNKLVEKSMAEVAETARRREATAQLRHMRRKQQEMRVEEKRKEREEKKRAAEKSVPREVASDDDDAEYYKQEVGLEPDAHFGVHKKRQKTSWNKKRKTG